MVGSSQFAARAASESSLISVAGLIAAALACLLILGVGTYSYHSGVAHGHRLDSNDSWNAGYVSGVEEAQRDCKR